MPLYSGAMHMENGFASQHGACCWFGLCLNVTDAKLASSKSHCILAPFIFSSEGSSFSCTATGISF